jgi:hypothetical protein
MHWFCEGIPLPNLCAYGGAKINLLYLVLKLAHFSFLSSSFFIKNLP